LLKYVADANGACQNKPQVFKLVFLPPAPYISEYGSCFFCISVFIQPVEYLRQFINKECDFKFFAVKFWKQGIYFMQVIDGSVFQFYFAFNNYLVNFVLLPDFC